MNTKSSSSKKDAFLHKSSSPLARAKRLKQLRNIAGLSIKGLGHKYNLGLSTLKCWEYAHGSGLSEKGAKKIITAMREEGVQCDLKWLLYGVGAQPQMADVRYGRIKPLSQEEMSCDENDYELLTTKEIELFCRQHKNAMTMAVLDDGMEPHYSVGDVVGGICCYGNDIEKALGKNCLIETEEKQVFCRRLSKGTEPGCYNLFCFNPNTAVLQPAQYNLKLVKIAPVVRLWKRNFIF